MKNYALLNFPVKLLRDDIDLSNLKMAPTWSYVLVKPEDYLTKEAIDFFASIGFTELIPQIFRGKPQASSTIHIDGKIKEDGELFLRRSWAINIVWGSTDSEMIWYKGKTNKLTGRLGDAGHVYAIYEPEQVVEIDRLKTPSAPFIVNTSIPHQAVNLDQTNYRWCLSIRDTNATTSLKHHCDWAEALKFFDPYIVID